LPVILNPGTYVSECQSSRYEVNAVLRLKSSNGAGCSRKRVSLENLCTDILESDSRLAIVGSAEESHLEISNLAYTRDGVKVCQVASVI